jgi:hypothetical protein
MGDCLLESSSMVIKTCMSLYKLCALKALTEVNPDK